MVSGVAPSVIRRAHGLSALPYVVNLPPSLGNRQEEALQNKYILNPKRLGSRGNGHHLLDCAILAPGCGPD